MTESSKRGNPSASRPSRKRLIRSLGGLRSDAPVWLQGVIVSVKEGCIYIDDGSGVVGVSTSLLESVDRPGAEAVEDIRVGTYVLVVGQYLRTGNGGDGNIRATTFRALTPCGGSDGRAYLASRGCRFLPTFA